ncbi:MAG TPA: glycerol-3-phosphate 1-O-acyltransferase PlsY [candidate division Zixibacteria bacterium]|nr:glycerol-3-phosphate 1-O-acyltransferase PlsY [candidate division Zixibacteria bacterium]
MTAALALIVFGYLLGSLPTGYLLGLLAGVDVRRLGSGNIGATNVARVVGKWQGMLTLAADAAKGFLPVLVAQQWPVSPAWVAAAGAAAFVGHLYPVFLRLRGGKGVATAFGVMLAMAPLAALALVAVFAAVFLPTRLVSLGAMVAAVAAPPLLWILSYPPPAVALGSLFAALIILRHRDNLRRLIAGTEPKFRAAGDRGSER